MLCTEEMRNNKVSLEGKRRIRKEIFNSAVEKVLCLWQVLQLVGCVVSRYPGWGEKEEGTQELGSAGQGHCWAVAAQQELAQEEMLWETGRCDGCHPRAVLYAKGT